MIHILMGTYQHQFSLFSTGFKGLLTTFTILFFSMSAFAPITVGIQQDQYRLHYGTTFSYVGRLLTYEQTWYHTFAIKLPQTRPITWYLSSTMCKNKTDLDEFRRCKNSKINLLRILNYTENIHDETRDKIVTSVNVIKHLIPQGNIETSQSRTKRSLLPFVGTLSRGLFGTATMDDLHVIEHHINILASKVNAGYVAFNISLQQMSSYMSRANIRMDGLRNAIKQNHDSLERFIVEDQEILDSLQSTHSQWIMLVAKELHLATNMEIDLQELTQGVYKLLNHQLSIELIPLEQMRQAVSKIRKHLLKSYPTFHLVHKDLTYYYSSIKVHYIRQEDTVYVTLLLPVTSNDKNLQLYQVNHYPIPLNHSSYDATLIKKSKPYIAISTNDSTFIEFSNEQYQLCKGSNLIKCLNLPAITTFQSPTCNLALFLNDIDMVHQICSILLIPNGTHTFMIELSSGQVLMSGIKRLSYVCNNKETHHSGCTFCVAPVFCGCSVIGDEFNIPPRLTRCHDINTKTNIQYTVNIALLRHFFTTQELQNQIGLFLRETPLQFSIPDFKIANHSFSKFLARDKQQSVDLQHAVERAKLQKPIFINPTDPLFLANEQSSWIEGWTNGPSYLTYISLIGNVILALWLGITARRVSRLVLLYNLNRASAALINQPSNTDLIWKQISTSPTTEVNHLDLMVKSLLDINLIFYVGLFITFLITIYFIINHKRDRRSHLILEIASRTHCAHVKLLSVSSCPGVLSTTVNKIIPDEISLTRRIINFDVICRWTMPKPIIVNNDTREQTDFPRKVNVSWINAYNINKIMEGDYKAYVYLIHAGIQYSLTNNSNGRVPISNTSGRISNKKETVSELPQLYPTLPQMNGGDIEMQNF